MKYQLFLEMLFQVIGGLAIFLLGMHNMSTGLQTVASKRLRALIGAVTNNRILAVGIGTLVTCIIQSSSVTTVMVVGFVNSGLMTLSQALGVIMGANIGTTITGWILVLDIGKYGLPILALAAFFHLFSRNERVRFVAMAVMGIGMVFFGLELMKDGFKPIRSFPEFEAWFHLFAADSYFGVLKCALVGCLLTLIVQSSSATLGVTIGLASTGIISFNTAAALVLGENIGTTITAFLASLNASRNAKRAAYGHVIFNILGVLWITAIFQIYISLVRRVLGVNPDMMIVENGAEVYPYIRAAIALVHTGFNVTNTIIFLPFMGFLAVLLKKIVPDKPFREPPRLTKLDIRMLESPMLIIEQSRREIIHMGENVDRMFECLREVLKSEAVEDDLVKKIFHREEVLDTVQQEISTFLVDILSGDLTHDIVKEAQNQLRMADEYESISDYITSILKLFLKMRNSNIMFGDPEKTEVLELHEQVVEYFYLVNKAVYDRNKMIIIKAHPEGDAITHSFRELRGRHLQRLSEKKMEPLFSVSYMNMLNSYRRIKDHIQNVAEALAGHK